MDGEGKNNGNLKFFGLVGQLGEWEGEGWKWSWVHLNKNFKYSSNLQERKYFDVLLYVLHTLHAPTQEDVGVVRIPSRSHSSGIVYTKKSEQKFEVNVFFHFEVT